jgi:hypothetical protein
MKNIIKIVLASLVSTFLVASANAGELTVTGTAKASYNILSGGGQAYAGEGKGKALGIANEITFGAAGELDNGWTWTYAVDYDPSDTDTSVASNGNANGVDDSSMTLTTPYGTFGMFITEGSLRVENAGSASTIARPSDIGVTTGITTGNDIDSYNNMQYHTPAGLLPFGITAKVAYATGLSNNINSANAEGEVPSLVGDAATIYRVDAKPIDGLSIGADYFQINGSKLDIATTADTVQDQTSESGAVYFKYNIGAATIGGSKTWIAPAISRTAYENLSTTIREVVNNKYSIAYNLSDATSLSYEHEKSSRTAILNSTAQYDYTGTAVEVAHNMGGMTIGVAYAQHDNVAYTNQNDVKQVLLNVTMAF